MSSRRRLDQTVRHVQEGTSCFDIVSPQAWGMESGHNAPHETRRSAPPCEVRAKTTNHLMNPNPGVAPGSIEE